MMLVNQDRQGSTAEMGDMLCSVVEGRSTTTVIKPGPHTPDHPAGRAFHHRATEMLHEPVLVHSALIARQHCREATVLDEAPRIVVKLPAQAEVSLGATPEAPPSPHDSHGWKMRGRMLRRVADTSTYVVLTR